MAIQPRKSVVKFFCECGQKVSVPQGIVQGTGKCPGCGRDLSIPPRAQEPRPPEGRAPLDLSGDLLLGTLANEAGYLRKQDLAECILLQERLGQEGKQRPIGELLVERGYLSEASLRWILANQGFVRVRAQDRKIGAIAVRNGFLSLAQVKEALTSQKSLYRREKRVVRLGELLVAEGRLVQQQVDALLAAQERISRGADVLERGGGGRVARATRPLQIDAASPLPVLPEDDDLEGQETAVLPRVAEAVPTASLATPAGPAEVVWETGTQTPAPPAQLRHESRPAPPARPATGGEVEWESEPEEIDPALLSDIERVEKAIPKIAGIRDAETRQTTLANITSRLARLTREVEAQAPDCAFLGRIYRAWGEIQAVRGEQRLSCEAYLAAFQLGQPLETERLLELGKWFIADRRTTAPALRLYAAVAEELPFQLDRFSEDDRSRVVTFLHTVAGQLDGEEADLRRRLAEAVAKAFPQSAQARRVWASWLVRDRRWAEAEATLRAAWASRDSQGPENRTLRAAIAREIGRACREQGNPQDALDFLERSAELDPLQADAFLEAAELVASQVQQLPEGTDSVHIVRWRGKVGKAMRWLERAEAHARGVAAHDGAPIVQRVFSAREALQSGLARLEDDLKRRS